MIEFKATKRWYKEAAESESGHDISAGIPPLWLQIRDEIQRVLNGDNYKGKPYCNHEIVRAFALSITDFIDNKTLVLMPADKE